MKEPNLIAGEIVKVKGCEFVIRTVTRRQNSNGVTTRVSMTTVKSKRKPLDKR